MNSPRAKQLLEQCGAVIEGHFVGTSSKHLSVYVAKDMATKRPGIASELCKEIAKMFYEDDIHAVVAPAVGGVALSQWTAHSLTHNLHPSKWSEVLALYAEHEEILLATCEVASMGFQLPAFLGAIWADLHLGDKLIIRKPAFVLKRGFKVDVQGKRVLVVEDVLTTGGSAKHTVDAVRAAGGIVVGVGTLAKSKGIKPADVGVEKLKALMEVKRREYTEKTCAVTGMCAEMVPINTEFGHGAEFLAGKR